MSDDEQTWEPPPESWRDRLTGPWVRLAYANNRAAVTSRRRYRRLYWQGLAGVAVAIAALVVVGWRLTSASAFVAELFLGLYIGVTSLGGLGRANVYRSAWIESRTAFVRAWAEAEARGMDTSDFLHAEVERDLRMISGDLPE